MPGDVIAIGFARDYERCRAHVHQLAAPLSDDEFWTKPFDFGNSFGHLVLHLTGNLSYYIGTRVADTGYVRTRNREFTDPERRPKVEVLRDFDAAVDMVLHTDTRLNALRIGWRPTPPSANPMRTRASTSSSSARCTSTITSGR